MDVFDSDASQPDDQASNLDSELKKMARMAKQYPQGSRERNKMTSRLLMMIEQSGKLFCPGKKDYPPEVYSEALQAMRLYIFRRLDAYDPDKAAMMTWVNKKLKYTFIDAANAYNKGRANKVSWSASSTDSDKGDGTNRKIEVRISTKPSPSVADQIRQIIEDDPDGIFEQRHIRGRPDVSYRAVALRICDGYSRREVAEFFKVKEQTLYSFFSRSSTFFKSAFQGYLRDSRYG